MLPFCVGVTPDAHSRKAWLESGEFAKTATLLLRLSDQEIFERSVLVLLLDALISLEIFLISIRGLSTIFGVDIFSTGDVRE